MREIPNINERVVFSFSLTCKKYIFSQKYRSSSDLKPITEKVVLSKYSEFQGRTYDNREEREESTSPSIV